MNMILLYRWTKIGTIKMKDHEFLQVVFYKTETNNEPVRNWLKSLKKSEKTKIGEDIKTVQFG